MLKVQTDWIGNVAVLHVNGRIVRGKELSTLRSAVSSQANAGAVILDLAMVDLIDAGGLGALLEMREWAHANGMEFKLENPNELVADVLRITRLDSVFAVSAETPANFCGAIAA